MAKTCVLSVLISTPKELYRGNQPDRGVKNIARFHAIQQFALLNVYFICLGGWQLTKHAKVVE